MTILRKIDPLTGDAPLTASGAPSFDDPLLTAIAEIGAGLQTGVWYDEGKKYIQPEQRARTSLDLNRARGIAKQRFAALIDRGLAKSVETSVGWDPEKKTVIVRVRATPPDGAPVDWVSNVAF